MVSNRRNNNRKNIIQNVRIVDQDSSTDSVRVGRMIDSIKTSESQIRLLCVDNTFQDNAATPIQGLIGFDYIFGMDEFSSIAVQFNEFRVRAIKFDVYDVNQNNIGGAMFSTVHEIYGSTGPVYSFAQVVDGPDSKPIPPGTGKETFYWVAHGFKEMEFQSTNFGSPNLVDRFGGLRYYINSGAAPGAKFQIVTHAVVDFRGRR